MAKKKAHENRHQALNGGIIVTGAYQAWFIYGDYVDQWRKILQRQIRNIQNVIKKELLGNPSAVEKEVVA